MKIPNLPWANPHPFGNLLYILTNDPGQLHPITDPDIENQMIQHLIRLIQENDAPPGQFDRLEIYNIL